jgi:hypothetical protein
MHPVVRVAAESAALSFTLVALATALLHAHWSAGLPNVIAPAIALGSVASAVVFIGVARWVRRRFPHKRPVLGARRGAALFVVALAVAAMTHALFTAGSAGLLYSVLGQVGYACLVGGGPAAAIGAVFGRWAERRLLNDRAR